MIDSQGAAPSVESINGQILPTARMVALFHAMQQRRYGGARRFRDHGLLESAVARGAQTLAYSTTSDIIEAICAVTEGIIRNHPFVDGNKRTAFATLVSTLATNGYRLEMEPIQAARSIVDYAASRITSERFRDGIRTHATKEPAGEPTGRLPDADDTALVP